MSCPTRITENSASLIDNVYANDVNSTLSCNCLTLDLSSHSATHTRITLGSSTVVQPYHVEFICYLKNKKLTEEYLMKPMTLCLNINSDLRKNDGRRHHLIDVHCTLYSRQTLLFDEIYMKTEKMKLNSAAYPHESEHVQRKIERHNPKPWILPWLEDAFPEK